MKEIKISVIIPVYNGEVYLKDTIEAVLMSTYKMLEIILVDDGSTDSSSRICRELAYKDKRIKYYAKKNEGISKARNFGLDKATGEYVCFCDQDDIPARDMYEQLINAAAANQADIAICSTGRLVNGEKVSYEELGSGVFQNDDILENILYNILFNGYQYDFIKNKITIYGSIWKYIISRELILNHNLRFKRFINYEDDLIMSIEALCAAKKVVTINKKMYFWRMNDKSESSAGKYIECLPEKLQAFDNYVSGVLRGRNINENILKEYNKILICSHYLSLIENVNKKRCSAKNKKKEFLAYFEKTKYEENLLTNKKLKKSQIKPGIILRLLKLRCVYLGIWADKILDDIRNIITTNKAGFILERMIKGIKR